MEDDKRDLVDEEAGNVKPMHHRSVDIEVQPDPKRDYGAIDEKPGPMEGRFEGKPMTYQSLKHDALNFEKAKSPKGFFDLVAKFCGCVMGSVVGLVFMLMLCFIPIINIVIGGVYIYSCQLSPLIPIYLIVAGVFLLLKAGFHFYIYYKYKHAAKTMTDGQLEAYGIEMAKPHPVDIIISVFLICWFIAGSVFIFGVYKPQNTTYPGASDYCSHVVYYYAFVITIIQWVLALLAVTLCCVSGCVACCCASKAADHVEKVKGRIGEGRRINR